MAKAAKAAKAKEGKAGGLSGRKIFMIFFAIILVILLHPTILLFCVGMLPTAAAFIIDRQRAKYTTKAVGYLNFCGCLPYALDLWKGPNDIEAALDILSNPLAWLVMFSSAAAGWLIIFSVPPVVAAYLSVTGEVKESSLKKRQKELVDEWGVTVRHRALGSVVEETDDDAPEGDGQP